MKDPGLNDHQGPKSERESKEVTNFEDLQIESGMCVFRLTGSYDHNSGEVVLYPITHRTLFNESGDTLEVDSKYALSPLEAISLHHEVRRHYERRNGK